MKTFLFVTISLKSSRLLFCKFKTFEMKRPLIIGWQHVAVLVLWDWKMNQAKATIIVIFVVRHTTYIMWCWPIFEQDQYCDSLELLVEYVMVVLLRLMGVSVGLIWIRRIRIIRRMRRIKWLLKAHMQAFDELIRDM